MTAPDVIDLAELAAMAKPLRHELGTTRRDIVRLIDASVHAATREARVEARQALRIARTRRDAYKRLLLGIQAVGGAK